MKGYKTIFALFQHLFGRSWKRTLGIFFSSSKVRRKIIERKPLYLPPTDRLAECVLKGGIKLLDVDEFGPKIGASSHYRTMHFSVCLCVYFSTLWWPFQWTNPVVMILRHTLKLASSSPHRCVRDTITFDKRLMDQFPMWQSLRHVFNMAEIEAKNVRIPIIKQIDDVQIIVC